MDTHCKYKHFSLLSNRRFSLSINIQFMMSCRTQIHEVEDVEQLYNDLMDLIVRFGNAGVIHGDFNEFNIMVTSDAKPIVIDFPQMVSTSHTNAQM